MMADNYAKFRLGPIADIAHRKARGRGSGHALPISHHSECRHFK
jgi:hypothetical protein